MSGHGASAEADSTAASARCEARSKPSQGCHMPQPADMPNSPGLYHTWWLLVVPFGGASWSAIDVVHGNLAAPDMIRRRRRNPPPQSSSSSLWPAMYSFVRLSMSLVFGLKMHLASAYCTTAMDCYCLPTAPQS